MTSDRDRRQRFEAVAADVFEPVQRYLRRRANAADAADAFAESLLVIWRRLDDVPDDDPLPWSYGVARRCLANQRRSNERRLRLVDRVGERTPRPPSNDPQQVVERLDPELGRALRALSDHDAEIVRLWAWEQLEPREIAGVLGLTTNAVSVALSRAKRILRDQLDRQDRPSPEHRPGGGTTERSER